jgi:heat-inducible transcriptional repressor
MDRRAREILRAIVSTHLTTGEPVGSRTLSRLTHEGLSPATIRNVMADLEDMGFLEQPHTSAGRIPTERGYRLYVDSMLQAQPLPSGDERAIREGLLGPDDLPARLERASLLLSRLSRHLAIVIAPSLSQVILRHVEFVALEGRRVLAIFVSHTGALQSRLLQTGEDLAQEDLTRMGNFLSSVLAGRTLPEVRNELLRRMSEEKAQYDQLLQRALELGARTFEDSAGAPAGVYVEGAANLLARAGANDLEGMRSLFRAFEDKHHIITLLNQCLEGQGVRVLIGSESGAPEMRGMSLVAAQYGGASAVRGALGVVGPLRMEYGRAISLVDCIARAFTEMLGSRSN